MSNGASYKKDYVIMKLWHHEHSKRYLVILLFIEFKTLFSRDLSCKKNVYFFNVTCSKWFIAMSKVCRELVVDLDSHSHPQKHLTEDPIFHVWIVMPTCIIMGGSSVFPLRIVC